MNHSVKVKGSSARNPTVKLKIPGKAFLKSESRTSVTFKTWISSYSFWPKLSNNGSGWDLSKSATMKKLWKTSFDIFWYFSNRYQCWIDKVKNYNLNVTEIRDSDFKNAFPGIFNFIVGILVHFLIPKPQKMIVFQNFDFGLVYTLFRWPAFDLGETNLSKI